MILENSDARPKEADYVHQCLQTTISEYKMLSYISASS